MIKTKNYDRFHFLDNNRSVNILHVKKLVKSISSNNLLEANPIIVNEKLEVIDGQHRLEAAKILQVPVYVTIVKNANVDDVLTLNTNQRNWTTLDYIHAYINKGVVDYQVLVDFAKDKKISYSIATVLLTGSSHNVSLILKSGKFRIKNLSLAIIVADLVKQIAPYAEENVLHDRTFHQCLYRLLEENKILIPRLLKKLTMYPTRIHAMSSLQMYYRVIEEIYNFAAKNKIRLF